MRIRTALIAALCLGLVLTRGLGLHVHSSHDHEAAHTHTHTHAHEDHRSAPGQSARYVIFDFSAGHLEAHLVHGDTDFESAVTAERASQLKIAVVLALIASLLLVIAGHSQRLVLPPWPPPRRRLAPYLVLPPSQAPPRAA